jgi:hypothetical protein
MKLLILFMLTCVSTFAQTNTKDIKVFAMDSKETQNTIDTLGESVVKFKSNATTIEGITKKEMKMLKKLAVDNHANAISVDLKRYWQNEKDEMYILYLKNK